MKRRKFIKNAGLAVSIPIFVSGLRLQANTNPFLNNLVLNTEAEDRILVVIQLAGGNDGLNTVIPTDQYSVLSELRETIFIPENRLHNINDNLKLHPSLSGLKNLWDDQKLEIILNVGYEKPNLSHFRSMDIWNTASDSDEVIYSGWLGRYLSELYKGYPSNYPNADFEDPISITVGTAVSTTCQGPDHLMGMAVGNINNIYKIDSPNTDNQLNGLANDELDYIRLLMSQTNDYLEVVEKAAQKGSINSNLWKNGFNNSLVSQLQTVARLINGGLKTKIYVCSLGGFDTHSKQVDSEDSSKGMHANLMHELSTAISSFQAQIKEYGVEDKVLGLTYSEFGRRIRSNYSNGTDHGEASCQFLFGAPVNPVIHGEYEEFNSDVGLFDNLAYKEDFRNIYQSVLESWFRVPNDSIQRIMKNDFETLPILKYTYTSIEQQLFEDSQISLYPNPAISESTLEFTSLGARTNISLFDANGNFIKQIYNKWIPEGNYKIKLSGLSNYSKGLYIIKIKTKYGTKTSNLIIS